VQQIKNLLPELGKGAGIHIIMPRLWDHCKRTLSIPAVSPKSSWKGSRANPDLQRNDVLSDDR
jgi:hypothetical protein